MESSYCPLSRLAVNRPWLKPMGMGAMIGLFVVGRPYPLFRKSLEYAVDTGNPLYGASAVGLHGLGNILIMAAVLLFLTYGTGGRFNRWVGRYPNRIIMLAAVSLIIGGAFFLTYWGIRVPSRFGVGWFPQMPYR